MIDRVPQDWLARLPGEVLCAMHVELQPAGGELANPEAVAELLQSETFAACLAAGGAAEVWMNFTINPDGFGRVLVRDHHLGGRQAGRLVQRLLEVETYRMMALLALPLARRHGSELTQIGNRLTETTQAMAEISNGAPAGVEGERQLLEQLTARRRDPADRRRNRLSFRRRARLLRAGPARIEELREERIEGQQKVSEFMDRRLSPAMRTRQAVADRLMASRAR